MAEHVDIAEQIITAAMTGTIEPDIAQQLIELHTRVTRHLFCPVTGQVLDSRTAHLLTLAAPRGVTLAIAVAPGADPNTIAERARRLNLTVQDRFDPTDAWTAITGQPLHSPRPDRETRP